MVYIIKHINKPLYWSNETGWGNKKGATLFTLKETKTLRLPMDGKWLEIKEC